MHVRGPLMMVGLATTSLLLSGGSLSNAMASPQVAASSIAVNRSEDPVVVSPSKARGLIGWEPSRLAAFRWRGAWSQIPVQVDQKKRVHFDKVYNQHQSWPDQFSVLVYADSKTFTGSDVGPLVDGNDEVVLMAGDVGDSAPNDTVNPESTVGSGVKVRVDDPISKLHGIVYLFQSDGSIKPSAGQRYVRYAFRLKSGEYRSTYSLDVGPNPENTTLQTSTYGLHFSDRWNNDGLTLGGKDILDRHKFMFEPGHCERSEETFSEGEGAFIANISGPVRAIRSVIGANSGIFTQRDFVMYRSSFKVTTYVRVHEITGGMDLYDYSTNAIGMTYRNSIFPTGVMVDGNRDVIPTGRLDWEQLNGNLGAATIVHIRKGLPAVTSSSYFLDAIAPTGSDERQCTGDQQAIATSGTRFGALPSTEVSSTNKFEFGRVVYLGSKLGNPTGVAESIDSRVRSPLTARSIND